MADDDSVEGWQAWPPGDGKGEDPASQSPSSAGPSDPYSVDGGRGGGGTGPTRRSGGSAPDPASTSVDPTTTGSAAPKGPPAGSQAPTPVDLKTLGGAYLGVPGAAGVGRGVNWTTKLPSDGRSGGQKRPNRGRPSSPAAGSRGGRGGADPPAAAKSSTASSPPVGAPPAPPMPAEDIPQATRPSDPVDRYARAGLRGRVGRWDLRRRRVGYAIDNSRINYKKNGRVKREAESLVTDHLYDAEPARNLLLERIYDTTNGDRKMKYIADAAYNLRIAYEHEADKAASDAHAGDADDEDVDERKRKIEMLKAFEDAAIKIRKEGLDKTSAHEKRQTRDRIRRDGPGGVDYARSRMGTPTETRYGRVDQNQHGWVPESALPAYAVYNTEDDKLADWASKCAWYFDDLLTQDEVNFEKTGNRQLTDKQRDDVVRKRDMFTTIAYGVASPSRREQWLEATARGDVGTHRQRLASEDRDPTTQNDTFVGEAKSNTHDVLFATVPMLRGATGGNSRVPVGNSNTALRASQIVFGVTADQVQTSAELTDQKKASILKDMQELDDLLVEEALTASSATQGVTVSESQNGQLVIFGEQFPIKNKRVGKLLLDIQEDLQGKDIGISNSKFASNLGQLVALDGEQQKDLREALGLSTGAGVEAGREPARAGMSPAD